MEILFTLNPVGDGWDIHLGTLRTKLILESGIIADFSISHEEAEGTLDYPDYELTTQEQTTVNNIIEASRGIEIDDRIIGEKNFKIRKFNKYRKLLFEIWYHTDNGDGTYDGKVEDIEYLYSGNGKNLEGFIITKYFLNGTIVSQEEYKYYQNLLNPLEPTVILKKVVI